MDLNSLATYDTPQVEIDRQLEENSRQISEDTDRAIDEQLQKQLDEEFDRVQDELETELDRQLDEQFERYLEEKLILEESDYTYSNVHDIIGESCSHSSGMPDMCFSQRLGQAGSINEQIQRIIDQHKFEQKEERTKI
eukprot:CAMPEP_0113543282 /NCGR_PEP_ID=MMETSP0015_2-20120614/10072_1 /TAXON_ID=2838 /ORGANISM="Odontella" /LENGTH=137 /DNA_ID=CAMNT_0000443425 /DNA_START=423 /DNA_END=836 /DNA_ORIENTATION=- /assembly_acc=CAM_ASM_000160